MKPVFPGVRFVPLGGVNAANLEDYIKAGAWAVGGTWLSKKELIEKNEMGKVTELTKEALRLVQEATRTHNSRARAQKHKLNV